MKLSRKKHSPNHQEPMETLTHVCSDAVQASLDDIRAQAEADNAQREEEDRALERAMQAEAAAKEAAAIADRLAKDRGNTGTTPSAPPVHAIPAQTAPTPQRASAPPAHAVQVLTATIPQRASAPPAQAIPAQAATVPQRQKRTWEQLRADDEVDAVIEGGCISPFLIDGGDNWGDVGHDSEEDGDGGSVGTSAGTGGETGARPSKRALDRLVRAEQPQVVHPQVSPLCIHPYIYYLTHHSIQICEHCSKCEVSTCEGPVGQACNLCWEHKRGCTNGRGEFLRLL